MNTPLTPRERKAVSLSCAVPVLAALTVPAGAMHIMEGYLPPVHAIAWGAGLPALPGLGASSPSGRSWPGTGRPFCCWP